MHRQGNLIILLLSIPVFLVGQKRKCATVNFENPILNHQEHRAETRSNKTVQLVFHILYNSEEEKISDQVINQQIDRINKDFNAENDDLSLVPEVFQLIIGKADITFVLASETPEGLPFSGVFRQQTDIENIANQISIDGKDVIKYKLLGGSDAYFPDSYVNIWIGRSNNVFGVTAPLDLAGTSDDGIIITPDAFGIIDDPESVTNLGRTLTHELGHYFGLNHLWGSNRGCGNDDDGIEDTPEQANPYIDCPKFPQVTCGSSDMFMNFMDFTNDECLLFFSMQQVDVMRSTLEEFRSGIIVSTNDPLITNQAIDVNVVQGDGSLTITNQSSKLTQVNVSIFTTGGQLIHKDLLNELIVHVIDTNRWPRGVYILAIDAVDQRFTHTFVAGY